MNLKYNNISSYSLQHHFGQIFKRIELGLFIFLSLLFLLTSKIAKDFNREVSFLFVGVSMPVVKVAAFPFNTIINLLTDFQQLIDAKKENEKLKAENDKMRLLYIKAINIENENKELKEVMNYAIPRSAKFQNAKIIGRTHGVFNQQLYLNAGKNKGFEDGNAVTGTIGMIGRVINVSDEKSSLMLLTDSNSHIPAISTKSRARGVVVGNNSTLMEMLYLSKTHQIQVGELIFTSGDGDTVPAGLLIGVVKKVDKNYVAIEMAEDVNNIDVVTVMQY